MKVFFILFYLKSQMKTYSVFCENQFQWFILSFSVKEFFSPHKNEWKKKKKKRKAVFNKINIDSQILDVAIT